MALCREAGFEPLLGPVCPQVISTVGMVQAGFGVTLVPSSVAALRPVGVSYHPIAGSGLMTAISLATRPTPAAPCCAALSPRYKKGLPKEAFYGNLDALLDGRGLLDGHAGKLALADLIDGGTGTDECLAIFQLLAINLDRALLDHPQRFGGGGHQNRHLSAGWQWPDLRLPEPAPLPAFRPEWRSWRSAG